MNEQEYQAIGSALRGITSGSSAGSFAYTPDQLSDLINEWLDLADDYERSRVDAIDMTFVEGPGTEFVSRSYASVANASGHAYLDSLESDRNYCLAQAQKLQNMLDDYLGQERRSVTDITNAGPQEGI